MVCCCLLVCAMVMHYSKRINKVISANQNQIWMNGNQVVCLVPWYLLTLIESFPFSFLFPINYSNLKFPLNPPVTKILSPEAHHNIIYPHPCIILYHEKEFQIDWGVQDPCKLLMSLYLVEISSSKQYICKPISSVIYVIPD